MENRRSYYVVLTLLMLIFAVLIIAVIVLSYAYIKAVNQYQDKRICVTEDCLRTATLFVETMNTSVDPCTDFYQFACGNYGKFHRITKLSDRFAELHDSMTISIKDFLEKEDSINEPFSVIQSRQLYRSCLATDEMDQVGLKSLVDILDSIGLPILIDQTPKNSIKNIDHSLSSTLANIKKHINFDYLFQTNIEPDPKNRTNNRITLGKPQASNIFEVHTTAYNIRQKNLRKIRETLASEEKVNEEDGPSEEMISYRKYVKSVWSELLKFQSNDSSPSIQQIISTTNEIIKFTYEYTFIKNEVYPSDSELPKVMTVTEFQNYTDNITKNASQIQNSIFDWKKYFSILLKDVNDLQFNFETDLIQISNIEYFKALFELLAVASKSEISTNIWWKIVTTLLPYTTNHMRAIQGTFNYESYGFEYEPSRSIYCANAVNKMMGKAVSYLLVDIKQKIERNIEMAEEMMANIHWAFEKIVKELEWMDDITKIKTLYKSQKMKTFFGYPEFINNKTSLDEYYADFIVVDNDYFANVISFLQRDWNETLADLVRQNDYSINSWVYDPLEANAYNWIQANAITAPAGMLQFPFFGHDLQVLNYGFLGSILGHELTHGFDNTGRKFDEDGNANMWWTNKTINEYETRTNCFIQHYETYLVPDIEYKVNGNLTLDENIADNGGIREALLAYRKFVANHGEELKLPGLEQFNNEQIYYLAFANNWCETTTNSSLYNSILDEHSPNNVRVIAALTNSEEFSDVWQCKKGTTMNPTNKKCKIW